MTYAFDPLVPRPIDQPTDVPLGDLSPEQLLALDEAKIFVGPNDPADREEWRRNLAAWRTDSRARHSWSGTAYQHPGATWAARCFTVAQVWLWDELLFSFDEQRFTPEKFLADAERFGGLDGVVLWHAYPIIGLDERNQWDYYRDVPGIVELVARLHELGVKVFVDYNPWDVGTRRAGDDISELAAVVKDLDADGVFLDTLKKAEPELVAKLQEARPGIILEGESKLAVERIEDHCTSWAQFFADSPVPGVLRAHWYERRHMQHHIRRWHRDHSEELQSAWLNGVGMMVWEVVFSVWVGWNPRDEATMRRMVTVQRTCSDLLLESTWTPLAELTPAAEAAGVHASSWEADGVTLWTLVNRGDADHLGEVLPGSTPIPLTDRNRGEGTAVFVPARGVAAVVTVAEGTPVPEWVAELAGRLDGMPHVEDARFPHRVAERVVPARSTSQEAPSGAIVLPRGPYCLTVRHRARETGMYQGAPYVNEWKPLAPRLHDARTLQRDGLLDSPVAVSSEPVTRAQFQQFLAESGWQPRVANRFPDSFGSEPDQPVTLVGLEDARAYCAHVGGRLPTEDEWQLAAEQSGFGRGEPAVWNWTESEHSDGRSRFVMLKGGSPHTAVGSEWYVEGGVHDADYAVKYLLPGLGLDRSPAVGFRVAFDLEEQP